MPFHPSSSMHSRQPLQELPLHNFIITDADEYMHDAKATPSSSKRAMSPSVLLSPPKRRILLAEGLLSPIRSPAKRLVFDSTPMETKSLMEKLNASVRKSRSSGESSSGPHKAITNPFVSYSSSSTSESHSRSVLQTPTPAPSTITPSLPTTPPPSKRSFGLAPSPEIVESPKPSNAESSSSSHKFAVPSLESALDRKRHRTNTSSGEASPLPPTPKRRHTGRAVTPAGDLDMPLDAIEEVDDKENVPPKKKKKTREVAQVMAPTTPVSKKRESSLTPRNKPMGSSKPTPAELRRRRAILEAEVDEPDIDLDDI